jgi:hypothetical protein
VCKDEGWRTWARRWWAGEDRSAEAAWTAAPREAWAWAWAAAAREVAWAAARAAEEGAVNAVMKAAYAAEWAWVGDPSIDLPHLAECAVRGEWPYEEES